METLYKAKNKIKIRYKTKHQINALAALLGVFEFLSLAGGNAIRRNSAIKNINNMKFKLKTPAIIPGSTTSKPKRMTYAAPNIISALPKRSLYKIFF